MTHILPPTSAPHLLPPFSSESSANKKMRYCLQMKMVLKSSTPAILLLLPFTLSMIIWWSSQFSHFKCAFLSVTVVQFFVNDVFCVGPAFCAGPALCSLKERRQWQCPLPSLFVGLFLPVCARLRAPNPRRRGAFYTSRLFVFNGGFLGEGRGRQAARCCYYYLSPLWRNLGQLV